MPVQKLVGSLVVVVVIAFPILVGADLLFDGPEFQVNTYTTSQQQPTFKAVARAADGRCEGSKPCGNVVMGRFIRSAVATLLFRALWGNS
jgi:hypothetical protein